MNQFEVLADARAETGKGAMRRMRRAGDVPGVLYGANKDVTLLKMERNRLQKQLDNEAFFSHILTVKVADEESQAVVKAMQRDPVTSFVTHLDFQRVSSTQELHMNVPLHFVNEDNCPGKRAGGVVSHLLVDVEIGCLPKDLPEYIEVDMSQMDIGDSLHLSDIKPPEGVTMMALAHDSENDPAIVSIQHPQKLDVEEEAEGLEAEAVEGEVPAAGEEAKVEGAADEEGGGA